jgi:cell division protein FtsW
LPFVSFGGSSLLVNAVAAGILLNISRQGQSPRVEMSDVTPAATPVTLDQGQAA